MKALLLRASHGIPAARTAPIVIAERVTDLLALLLLALVGVFSFDVDRRFLIAGAVLVVGGVLVVSIDPLAKRAIAIAGRLPLVRRFAHRLDEFHSQHRGAAGAWRRWPSRPCWRSARGSSSAWRSDSSCAAFRAPASACGRRPSSMRR